MRLVFVSALLVFSLSTAASGQTPTREQKLRKIDDLNSQINGLEAEILLPAAEDFERAGKEGFEVFRLMPRERYDRKRAVHGGAYYSFTNRSHDYQKIAQISLEDDYLSVGFAGADYGFFSDLGNVPLAEVSTDTGGIEFLLNYKPPTSESAARAEQKKSHNYETENATFARRVPVSLDFTFALRAISFDRADVLVAFRIHRRDKDGSLIVFWKPLKNFEVPMLVRDRNASTGSADFACAGDGRNRAAED
ncbi:MAG TPA: hypothetical protein VIL74_12720 [Pyrinomonadaceae bacterium]|jgi:hypothetical protein